MFISKRKFLEELNKAKEETANQIYKERNLDERFMYVNRDIQDLHRRVAELENKLNTPIKNKYDDVAFTLPTIPKL